MAPRLSVVVPVGPGDQAWRGLLKRLEGLREIEVVVVFPEGDGEAERGSPARRAPTSLPDRIGELGGSPARRAPTSVPDGFVEPGGSPARRVHTSLTGGFEEPDGSPARRAPTSLPNRFGESVGARLAGDHPSTTPQSPVPPPDPDAPIRHLTSPRGRAAQQNAGAHAARAPLLWFLHADSRPDDRAFATVQSLDTHAFDALGWFHLAFHDGKAAHRLNAFGANLRSRLFALPFGDQGLLLPAERFAALGGFDESLALGEDLDLVVRARHAGLPLRALPGHVATSARRYREHGWWRTTRRHLALTWSLRRAARTRFKETP